MSRIVRFLFAALLIATAATPAGAQAYPDTRRVPADRHEAMLSFAPLVKRTAPAVVNIYTRRVVSQRGPALLFNDPFFRRFFGDLPAPRSRIQNSLGSGVIVDPSGLIVTAAHVIEGADEVQVVLSDRRELEARIVQVDERSDVAVLRVQGVQALPSLPLGDSEAVQVGDIVLAIGNPFGVGQTVTSGIISATARTTGGDEGVFIQTDAAINPGNSGGPLISMTGEVIGINDAIYSRSGGSHGIGFAIPSNLVRAVMTGYRATGRVIRPWLGGDGQAVTSDIAASMGLDRPRGVLLSDIYPGGPLERAGVRQGDVITSVDQRPVDDPASLRFRLSTAPVGGTVQLGVWRPGRGERTVALPVEPPPENPPRQQTPITGDNPFSGAVVANVSPALAEEMQISGVRNGVVIVELEPRSIAARLGLRPGDVIVGVNGREVRRVDDLRAAVARRASSWQLAISRGGRVMNLSVG